MNGSTRSCSPSLVVVTLLGIILILLPLGTQGFAQSEEDHRAWLRSLDSLSSERMLADVTTLSSPAFNGRQTGTADDASSAKWVADRFLAFGLSLARTRIDPISPQGQGRGDAAGFMTTTVTATNITPDPLLRISTASDSLTQQLGTDYLPILDSPSADVRGPIVFVGYGIIDVDTGYRRLRRSRYHQRHCPVSPRHTHALQGNRQPRRQGALRTPERRSRLSHSHRTSAQPL